MLHINFDEDVLPCFNNANDVPHCSNIRLLIFVLLINISLNIVFVNCLLFADDLKILT